MASRSQASTRLNNWWIPSDGIARVVIQADIQRYLGPDALVKPGVGINENEGRPGYWITAYRTLTSKMIEDLKLDTQRWETERLKEADRRGSPSVREGKSSRRPDFVVGEQQDPLEAYQGSVTHQSRSYYGPTEPYGDHQAHQQAHQGHHYTHGSSTPHSYSAPQQQPYGVQPNPYQPRTTNPAPYPSSYTHAQPPRVDHNPYGAGQPQYQYSQPPANYGQPAHQQRPPPPTYSQPSRVAREGYYIASDNREYPIPPGGIPGQRN